MARPSIREQLHAEQGGLCAYCHRPLSLRASHRHHLVPGREGRKHRVLVHPACHRKIHRAAKARAREQ